ncbi:MAG: FecR domain-containing protein [Silvanigrellaceae bacterium]
MNPSTVNPNNRLLWMGLCSLSMFFGVDGRAIAADAGVAEVSAFSGVVKLIRSQQQVEIVKGVSVRETDKVETGPGGIVQLRFKDGSSFTIYERSAVSIEKFKRASSANSGGLAESTFDVLNGKLKFFVNPKAKVKTSTQFRSKTAIMGIRGTSGVINVAPDGATQLVVLTGLVEVRNPKFPDVSIPVSPNFSTRVDPGVVPEAPKPVSKEQIQKLVPAVSAEMGFTEDGPSVPGSEKSPDNSGSRGGGDEKKKPDERPDGEKRGSEESNEPSGQGEKENNKPGDRSGAEEKENKKSAAVKSESEDRQPEGRRASGTVKPIFAPGGTVVNSSPNRTPDTNKTAVPSDSSQTTRSTQAPASTSEDTTRVQGAEVQPLPVSTPVPVPVVNVTREVEKITSTVTATIERVDEQVQEKVISVQPTVAPTPRPQKVNVKIGLPSD